VGGRHLGLLALLAATTVGLVATSTAPAAVKKCPTGKLTRVTNGVRVCVPRTAFRITRAAPTRLGSVVQIGFGNILPVRRRNGRTVPPVVTSALGALARRTVTSGERVLVAAVTAARGATVNERRRRTADPTFTATRNADGSASGTLTQTVDGANGSTVALQLGIGVKPGSGSADSSLSVELTGTVLQRSGASKLAGLRLTTLPGSTVPTCPTADGRLPLKSRASVTQRSGETFGSARVRLGAVREATTAAFSSNAQGRMGPDARLRPIAFSTTVTFDYSASGQVLAFFGNRVRAKGTATVSGTLDPVTGAITQGTVVSNTSAFGFQGTTPAQAAATFRPMVEKLAKDEAGRVFRSLKEAEARARGGECTTLTFVPASPGSLPPGASTGVQAQLATRSGNAPVPGARWSAIAAKGGVSPTVPPPGSSANLTVTGAAPGPVTATINVKAVSPAGISQGTWEGRSGSLPPSYSGTVSLSQVLGPLTETWQGTFTWTKTSETANPDGSIFGLYELTAASVHPFTWSGNCVGSSTGPSGTIVAGDAEVDISPSGQWSSAFLLDVAVAPFTVTCSPAPPTVVANGKAFLNSRSPSGLRPMPSNGAITATNVTDVGGGVVPTVASWNILPGS
jgi:hypothetical protein